MSDAIPADDLKRCDTPDSAISRLKTLYDGAIKTAAQQFNSYTNNQLEKGAHPPVYPYLLVKIPAERSSQTSSLALGQVASDQDYGLTVTQPGLFGQYLLEQLSRLRDEFGAHIYVGRSKTAIPLTLAP